MKLPPHAANIRIFKRFSDVAVFFDALPLWGGRDCIALFQNAETAQRFAAGEAIVPVPEKRNRIRFSDRARHYVSDAPWTERSTSTETLTVPITVYHFGRATKTWRAQVTCFYRKWPESKAEVPVGTFIAEIPAGAHVTYFGADEVRVDLAQAGCRVWAAA